MKRTIPILAFLVISVLTLSQDKPGVYEIVLTDKDQSVYSVDDPSAYLSQRAIERRERYGIPINKDDLPISPSYLDAIESTGARVLAQSKWLNKLIVETDDIQSIAAIEQLDFVSKVQSADHLMVRYPQLESEFYGAETKPFFRQERTGIPYQNIQLKGSDATLSFDYGESLNQIQMVNGTGLHNQGYTGEGLVIAVLDAGFWKVDDLPAFDSLWLNNRILGTRDYVDWGGNVFDSLIHQHGMMVLSIMGGNLPGDLVGTAPHASYYLFRTEDATAEYLMEEYYWVMGAEYADSLGVDIINSSLGYTVFDDPMENHSYQDMDGNTTPITIGADKAAEKGILVCNSAGNSGSSPWMYIGAPADGDSVFSIGAVDPMGNWATFSSLGPTYDGRIKPNIAAQGQSTIIAAPWGGITGGSGTSFSSPLIAGITACLWQANHDFNNMSIISAIEQSASQSDNPDDYLGFGIPDYQAANNILGTTKLTDPSFLSLTIYPNPTWDHFHFIINLSSAQSADLVITDITGRIVDEARLSLQQGEQRVEIPARLRDPGIYMIRLRTNDKVFTGKAMRIP